MTSAAVAVKQCSTRRTQQPLSTRAAVVPGESLHGVAAHHSPAVHTVATTLLTINKQTAAHGRTQHTVAVSATISTLQAKQTAQCFLTLATASQHSTVKWFARTLHTLSHTRAATTWISYHRFNTTSPASPRSCVTVWKRCKEQNLCPSYMHFKHNSSSKMVG